MNPSNWYRVQKENQVQSPGLVVYPDRIQHNIDAMITLAGGIDRLWPHIKTHKMEAVVRLQMKQGIRRFKCATMAEVQLLIHCEVDHILLAHQPTREKCKVFLALQKKHPNIRFSTLVDNTASLQLFSELAAIQQQKLGLWIDINNGMNRTGILPAQAQDLYKALQAATALKCLGLHVYDGHVRSSVLDERMHQCQTDFLAVEALIQQIEAEGGDIADVICGGSPSFYPHSQRAQVYLSPGTTLLWDLGYHQLWRESPFLHAALVVTRLISKPNTNLYCFDLGHKAVASEMPLPRVEILGMETAVQVGQSEEHLMVEYTAANDFKIGDLFYALPYHICPTVAKYNNAHTAIDGKLGNPWKISAREYHLSF